MIIRHEISQFNTIFLFINKRIMVFFDVISSKCPICCASEPHADAHYIETEIKLSKGISVNPVIKQVLLLLGSDSCHESLRAERRVFLT
jgi:hypothetical protein